MSNLRYISIKSVLADIATMVDENVWNEALYTEWAHKALSKFRANSKFDLTVCFKQVEEHKAEIPSDARYIVQILYRLEPTAQDIEYFADIMGINLNGQEHMEFPENLPTRAAEALFGYTRVNWKPMRLTMNPFTVGIHCAPSLLNINTSGNWNMYDYSCPQCSHEYVVSPSGAITTTLKEGWLAIAYLRYPKTDSGDTLIPDNESLKDGIFHFVMYRHLLKRYTSGDNTVEGQMMFHLQQFQTLATKARGEVNEPDVATLEAIKSYRDRLVPKENMYEGMFSQLGNRTAHPQTYSGPRNTRY